MDNTLEKLIEALTNWRACNLPSVSKKYEEEVLRALAAYEKAQEAGMRRESVTLNDLFDLLQLQHAEQMDVLDQINKSVKSWDFEPQKYESGRGHMVTPMFGGAYMPPGSATRGAASGGV